MYESVELMFSVTRAFMIKKTGGQLYLSQNHCLMNNIPKRVESL